MSFPFHCQFDTHSLSCAISNAVLHGLRISSQEPSQAVYHWREKSNLELLQKGCLMNCLSISWNKNFEAEAFCDSANTQPPTK
jgi:hypothetical protein